ncbi:LysR family transcriptional regulator [Amorphus sp. 3PC139-8]|uniref:LysR family transcriptional regulator n=1 Tax=Amorphus sp. 3PC139-8 TaxID=2735676 RepID=UPI00345CD837
MDLNTLRAFVRTVECGSLSAAARDLAISQPAITKHIHRLEEHLDARLLERTARAVRLTVPGLALYEASCEALAKIDAAMEGVRRDGREIEGKLRLFAPSCIGVRHLHPIVMAFQEANPGVVVDLVLDNREADLVYENFDLALRYGKPASQNTVVRRIGWVHRLLVAAPSYLDQYGAIRSIDDLTDRRVIATTAVLSPRGTLVLHRDSETVELAVAHLLKTNNAQVIVSSLLAGQGPGPVQAILVDEELAQGRLVRILPDYDVAPTELYLAYPSVRFMRPVVRAFVDFLTPRLKAADGID